MSIALDKFYHCYSIFGSFSSLAQYCTIFNSNNILLKIINKKVHITITGKYAASFAIRVVTFPKIISLAFVSESVNSTQFNWFFDGKR